MILSLAGIFENKPFWVALLAWTIAQGMKIVLTLIFEKRLDLTRIVGTGGMPSSHSTLVMSLATSIGKSFGFESPFFAIAIIFAFVVMYDAAGIRRAAGKQAEILNYLIQRHELPDMDKLKELLGHTPLEVFAGAILGICIGLWI